MDIAEFLDRLNAQSDTINWRLPSEAEWEYACRAGSDTRFSWGDDLNFSEINNYAWFEGNSSNKTHLIGQKEANDWDLHDMNGNVFEWCEDNWHDNYNGAPTDGSPWIESDSLGVLRGGAFGMDRNHCRSTSRWVDVNQGRNNNFGFRIAF